MQLIFSYVCPQKLKKDVKSSGLGGRVLSSKGKVLKLFVLSQNNLINLFLATISAY